MITFINDEGMEWGTAELFIKGEYIESLCLLSGGGYWNDVEVGDIEFATEEEAIQYIKSSSVESVKVVDYYLGDRFYKTLEEFFHFHAQGTL
jgi:hypothetical protein